MKVPPWLGSNKKINLHVKKTCGFSILLLLLNNLTLINKRLNSPEKDKFFIKKEK
jgi:hypothetical protein